LLHEEVKETVQ